MYFTIHLLLCHFNCSHLYIHVPTTPTTDKLFECQKAIKSDQYMIQKPLTYEFQNSFSLLIKPPIGTL